MSGDRSRVALAFVLVLTAVAMVTPLWAAVAVGDKAPSFKLGSVDGKSTVDLSSYTDKPTLLVFWASWCPHCQRELPVLQKIYNDLSPKGVNVVGVSVDQVSADAGGFLKNHAITFPNAYAGSDRAQRVLATYGITGIPTVYVLDKGGTVKERYSGEIDDATIRSDFAKMGMK